MHMQLLVADNDTVPISVWCGGGVNSTEHRLVLCMLGSSIYRDGQQRYVDLMT